MRFFFAAGVLFPLFSSFLNAQVILSQPPPKSNNGCPGYNGDPGSGPRFLKRKKSTKIKDRKSKQKIVSEIGFDFEEEEEEDYSAISHAIVGAPVDTESGVCGDYLSGLVTLTGEYHLFREDLYIEGRGFPWRFSRIYKQSDALPYYLEDLSTHPRFGHGWTFTYADRLVIESPFQVSLFEGGRLRSTTWADNNSDGFFEGIPTGENSRLFKNLVTGEFERIDLEGNIWCYESSGRLSSLEDRAGNRMQFFHGENSAPSDALTSVIDTLGREIVYHYYLDEQNDPVRFGRLWKVVDFSGREIVFTYDEVGNLSAVTTPTVNQTFANSSNTFPAGKTESYEYDFNGFGQYALTHITRPNENDFGYGEAEEFTPFLINVYDPMSKKVTQQHRGPSENALGQSVSNTLTFSYQSILDPQTQMENFDPSKEDSPSLRTTVIDRNGHERVFYTAATTGAVTRMEIEESNVLEGSTLLAQETLIHRYHYDNHNQLLQETFPNGKQEIYVYDSASNVIEKKILPGVNYDPITQQPTSSAQTSRIRRFTYEPIFNQVLSVIDERGNDPNFEPDLPGTANGQRYLTHYFYDFMEGNQSALSALASKYHRTLTPAQLQSLALNQDLNGDNRVDQQAGKRIKIDHPSAILDSNSPQVSIEGSTTQSIVELFAYDDFGQIVFEVDPEGNVSRYFYFPEIDPDGDGNPTPNFLGNAITGGFLRERLLDTSAPPGSNPALSPQRRETVPLVGASSHYFYDPRGNLLEFVNPRGIVFLYEINERDQVYREIRGAGTQEQQEIRSEYDANDNRIRQFVENSISPAGPWVEESWDYDLADRLIRHRAEIVEGDFAEWISLYDGNGNLAKQIQPQGNAIGYQYNTRDQRILTHRGVGSPENARSESFYDRNGNLVRHRAHTETSPDLLLDHHFLFDGYDRLIGEIDPVGTRTSLLLDPVSNLIQKEVHGYLGGASPNDNQGNANVLLSSQRSYFDEHDRVWKTETQVFGDEGHALESGGKILQRFAYDRLGRLNFAIEHDGDTRQNEYDGRSRLARTLDPLQNEVLYFYDPNDNLIETKETELATNGALGPESFFTTVVYDALDRQIRISDNLGQTRRFSYDTQGNLIHASDANGPVSIVLPRANPQLASFPANLEGNVLRFFYDGLKRLTKKEILLTSDGLGNGSHNPTTDLTQSGDGLITIQSEWDKNSRLIRQIDDKGNKARTFYDALNRQVAIQYGESSPEQSVEIFQYDGANRLTQKTDQNGSVIGYEYDRASRLTRKFAISLVPGLIGTSEQVMEYDGLGRLTFANDQSPGESVSFTRQYDSLSRLYRETQNHDGASEEIESFWQAENLRSSLLYPNGRSLAMSYDSLNRVNTLDGNFFYEYQGPGRVIEKRYPNGTKQSLSYDRGRRVVSHRWLKSNNERILDFRYHYDRENHRTSTRRYHELSTAGKPKGETYRYDSAYRLIEWKEGALFEGSGFPLPSPGVPPGDSIFGGGILGGNAGPNGSRHPSSGSSNPYLHFAQDDVAFDDDIGVNHAIVSDSQNWKLDGVGNWEQMSRRGVLINSTASVHNEYTSVGGQAQTHDNNGNLLDDGIYLYDYDFLNRLRRVVKKSTLQELANYQYDALNRRVRKETTAHATTGASFTRFLYDGWHAIEKRDASNAVTKQFVYGERIDEILKMDRYISGVISSTYYYHDDILGSVCALSDTSGNVVERVKYSPYGQPYFLDNNQQPIRDLQGNFATQSSLGNPLLFTAAKYDSELSQRTNSQITDKSGNYYLRNRYLNPNQGRFLTRDPIGIWTDDVNLGGGYSYAGNDPVNNQDFSGLKVVLRGRTKKFCKTKKEEAEKNKKLLEKGEKLIEKLKRESKTTRERYEEMEKDNLIHEITFTDMDESNTDSWLTEDNARYRGERAVSSEINIDSDNERANLATTVHELAHSYDVGIGKFPDGHFREQWTNPDKKPEGPWNKERESSAISFEQQVRKELGIPPRESYGPWKVDPDGTLGDSLPGWVPSQKRFVDKPKK